MQRILNGIFHIFKFILLVAAFAITLMIIIQMNNRLNKGFITTISVFIPYIVLFILFCINLIFRRKGVNKNIFYNITCCLSFATILVAGYRAYTDKNMILNQKYGYGIDFNYFNNFISYMKIMLYGLSLANIFLMFQSNKEGEEIEELEESE